MPRLPRSAASAARTSDLDEVPQLDLFPERPIVEALDPRAVVGPRTGVRAVVRVRTRGATPPHLVFHDRHGWYCETHGPACAAVRLAKDATGSAA